MLKRNLSKLLILTILLSSIPFAYKKSYAEQNYSISPRSVNYTLESEENSDSYVDQIAWVLAASPLVLYVTKSPKLAKEFVTDSLAALGVYNIFTGQDRVYYNIKQYRGLKYGGFGGNDIYYLKVVITTYKDVAHTKYVGSSTKIMESISPMSLPTNPLEIK